MNTQLKGTIAETIKKEHLGLRERGLPEHSYFEVEFADNSKAHEREHNWSDISEEVLVKSMGRVKAVRLCKHPLKKISISHAGQTVTLEVPPKHRAYQAIIAESVLIPNQGTVNHIIGRIVGLVNENGEVVEERSINGLTGEVFGFKN